MNLRQIEFVRHIGFALCIEHPVTFPFVLACTDCHFAFHSLGIGEESQVLDYVAQICHRCLSHIFMFKYCEGRSQM